jgi:serine/threonine-protein kinase
MTAENNNTPLLEKGIVLNGKWEILEHIATGGKGEVYRARQLNLEREVAVKIISEELLSSHEGDEEEIQTEMERFRREVLTMAQVRHPNILQVYDQDRAVIKRNGDELPIDYIVMEYIPGPTLRSTMPQEGLRNNEKEIRKWIRDFFFPILDGVEIIHELGIVHRDLKPENVLLDEFTPKIADFGLAGGPRWQQVTRSHHMDGTIPYMSREQIMDMGEADFRGDIYALGKILYEAVIGKMSKDTTFPFKTARLQNPDTPFLKRLDHIIQQATAEDKKKRIPSVKVFRKALLDLLEATEESFRPSRIWRKWLVLAMALLIVAGSIGFHILYHREKTSLPDLSLQPLPRASIRKLPSKEVENIPPPVDHKASLPLTLEGKDGATLHLIPKGELILPEYFGPDAGKPLKVQNFYMDETEVTNHLEFLNQVLPRIRVEGGVVQGDGVIWLLLGEVMEGYEPIVFRNGKFSINDPALASHPVVRVTAYGAEAYARFYERRLPTELEWLYAMRGGDKSSDNSPIDAPEPQGIMMHMMDPIQPQMDQPSLSPQTPYKFPTSVGGFKPNAYGIRGLDGNVSEWGLRFQKPSLQREKQGTEYIVLGGLRKDSVKGQQLTRGIKRFPWEAFEEVGFRCALDIPR